MLSRKSAKSNAQVTLKFTLIEKVQKKCSFANHTSFLPLILNDKLCSSLLRTLLSMFTYLNEDTLLRCVHKKNIDYN